MPLEAHQQQRFLDAKNRIPPTMAQAFVTVSATRCKQPCISLGDMLVEVMQAAAAYRRLN